MRRELQYRLDKLTDKVIAHIPMSLRLKIMFMTMGALTVIDRRLHDRIVPTITVEEFIDASKVASRTTRLT
jgi:hypothetical protein